MSNNKPPVLKLVEEIIAIDPGVRFASIIDKDGNVVEGIMNSKKTNLKSQQEQEYFCKQVANRRAMRKEFDNSLGKVRYVHVEREKLTQIVLYPNDYTIYFTLEPEMAVVDRVKIINKVKKLVSGIMPNMVHYNSGGYSG
ncbi:MAG: hypothetical protein K8823_578 [Cenarchaeum symbiont of Oopsacas minuta]|nr:hypothetical protein [Cenarchaeum symbiont of Oopsacas minuta]